MNTYKNSFQIIASGSGDRVPLEVTAAKKGKVAIIGIKGSIYSWSRTSSFDIENTIRGYKEDGITEAEVYINSGGGDCFEANQILNLIEDNFKTIKVRVGAIAASAGTIFITKYWTSAKKNSQFMIHKPMGNPHGNEDDIEAGLKLIKNMTKQYKGAYAKKMGISEEEVEKLWAKGDYWMTADEALKMGLIDEIEDEEETIDAYSRALLVACKAPHVPIKTPIANTNQNNNNHMELSVLAVSIGLPATATQAQVDAKLKELMTAHLQVEALTTAAKNKEKAEKATKIKALLDKAEQDKKITAEQRSNWQTMAEANYDSTEKALEAMLPIEAISEQLNPGASGEGEQVKGREKWTYADYQEKAPRDFDKLPEDKQKALADAHYEDNE